MTTKKEKTFRELTPTERSKLLEANLQDKTIQFKRHSNKPWEDQVKRKETGIVEIIFHPYWIYKIKSDKIFEDLTKKEKLELFEAWIDGKTIESKQWKDKSCYYSEDGWVINEHPRWGSWTFYRIKEDEDV